jgi:LytS/YehU family sensor histidine kinase
LTRQAPTSANFRVWIALDTAAGFAVTLMLRPAYRRILFRPGSVLLSSCAVLAASAAAANVWFAGEFMLNRIMGGDWEFFVPALEKHYEFGVYIRRMYFNTWIYATWSFLYFVIKFWMAWRHQREQTERLEVLAQQAQIKMLRYQLNPHFLFNALNSIRAMAGEAVSADRQKDLRTIITNLAGFLRYSLESGDKDTVPLAEEITAARRYLEIEQVRFEDLLEVEIDVEPDAETFEVPCFLIQPLIENAVKFGMQTSESPLRISIKASRNGGDLAVSVVNSGSWIEPSSHGGRRAGGTGTGLSNLRGRLEAAYPHNHRLEIDPGFKEVAVKIVISSAGADEQ